MNNLDNDYKNLLKDILENGHEKNTRNGKTKSVFGRQIRHKMSEGFPLLTTKKMYFKGVVTELIWFLRGETNIKYLVDNDCHIWDGDCFANYQKEYKKLYYHTAQMGKEEFINRIKTDDEFAKKWGNLGKIYGAQWREWSSQVPIKTTIKDIETGEDTYVIGTKYVDQIANLINDLKTNPDSRRLMVNVWNVSDLDQMVLPPCHYGFQVYTRELSWEERVRYYETSLGRLHFIPPSPDALNARNIPTRAISLMWSQRSVDTPLGLPFNLASYGLLLEILALEVNMVPDELICNLGDTHIYLNQIEGVKEQLTREPFKLPSLKIAGNIKQNLGKVPFDEVLRDMIPADFTLENYQSHPAIKMPLSN